MKKKLLSVAILAALYSQAGQTAIIETPASADGFTAIAPNEELTIGGSAAKTVEVNADGEATAIERARISVLDQGQLRVVGNGTAGSASVSLGADRADLGTSLSLDGNSSLQISNGGQLTASGTTYPWALYVSQQDGDITVDGNGSLFSVPSITVGDGPNATATTTTFTVSNGAHAEFTDITYNDSYFGTPFPLDDGYEGLTPTTSQVLVTGSGSQLDVAHTLHMSNGGLSVMDGAQANLAALNVNDVAGTGSQALVSGMGSQLNVSGDVNVGSDSFEGGTVTVSDGGLLSASSLNLLSGAILNGDGGTVAADVAMTGGTIAPGESTGSLTIDGNLDWADGLLEIEIASLSDFDQLNVLGSTTLGADSEVLFSFVDDFMPDVGDMFEFLLTDSLLGDLSMLDFVVMGLGSSDLAFSLIETDGGLALYTGSGAAPVPLPAAFWLFFAGIGAALSMAYRQNSSSIQQATGA